jgi:phosphoglycerate dehydrogenase-like enzyme
MPVICVPTPEDAENLTGLDGVRVVVWDGTGDLPDGIDEVTFFVGPYMVERFSRERLAVMPQLRVIQLLSAGVDPWLPLVPEGVVLCNGRGVHGISTAELAVGGLLSLLRGLPDYRADQLAHRWSPTREGPDLDGRRVLLIGAGEIAQAVAAAVEVFGAETTLVARTARAGVHTMADLPGLLPEHDVVVLALPYTAETDHLVDAAFLAAMPDGAILVNVARGRIVDTDALLAELTRERLSAFLDVVDPEPLPEDHPLWDAPNVLLTPHVGGGTDGWRRRGARLIRAQVERFVAGQPLQNVVGSSY